MIRAEPEPTVSEIDPTLLTAEKEAFSRLAKGHGITAALDSLLTAVERLAGEDVIASVWTVDAGRRTISFCGGPRVPAAYRDVAHGTAVSPDRGSCGLAVTTHQPVVVPDVQQSALWSHCADVLRELGLRASWSTPILSSLGSVLGTVAVHFREPCEPRDDHRRLINRVSQTAALLLERHQSDDIIAARERALGDYREQLRLISDSLPVLVSYVDRDECYQFCNQRYVEWFGLSTDEIVGRHMAVVLGDEAWKTIGPKIKAALAGHPVEYEAEVPYRSGGVRWIHAVYTPHCGDDRQVVGVVVHVSDITERKRLERAVKEGEERFRRYFELGLIGSAITSPTKGWIEVNDEICSMLGYERHELMGMTWADLTHPDDLAADIREFDRVVSGEIDGYALDKRFIRKDGRVIDTMLSVKCLRRGDGAVDYFLAMVQDITERTRAEAALRDSEERYRRLVTMMPAAMYTCDRHGRITFFNGQAVRVWGRAPSSDDDEIRFCGSYRLFRPDGAPLPHDCTPMADALRHGTRYRNQEVVIERPDGTRSTVLVNIDPLMNEGMIIGAVNVFTDITERKQAEQALQEREEELRELTERLEHRVAERTRELVDSQRQLRALATELNLTEQRERKRLAAELHDHLQQLLVLGKLKLGQGKRVAETLPACADVMKQTDEILTEALAYTRTLVAELSPPVLREHGLAASLKWLGEYMKRHDMTVTVTVPERHGLNLSEDQAILLFQSVRELLINTSKHAGTRHASVTLESSRSDLRIDVHDEGEGFDAQAVSVGSGDVSELSSKFGLYSIRERMKALGGRLDMTSAPGKGTTATLTLPLPHAFTVVPERRSAGGETGSTRMAPLIAPSKSGVIRVLLVDDHAMMRQGLRSVLEGYADIEVVGEACDGEEAVNSVGALLPKVVVMDINMPRMDGIAATQHIRTHHPEIVILGLSVNASPENQQAMRKAGAALLLTKEAAVEHLYLAIRQITVTVPEPS